MSEDIKKLEKEIREQIKYWEEKLLSGVSNWDMSTVRDRAGFIEALEWVLEKIEEIEKNG